MQAQQCPLFTEYICLARDAGWEDIVAPEDLDLGPTDGLVIVDMENDFVPVDDLNPHGGAFACTEGNVIAPLVARLAEAFAAHGGVVAACRDYHPKDHCSFIPNGGEFPPHCVQGSVGSHFYKPIGDCVQSLRMQKKKVSPPPPAFF